MRKAWKCHYSQLKTQKINSNNPNAFGLKLAEQYVDKYKLKKHKQKNKFQTGSYEWPGKAIYGSLRGWGDVFFSAPPLQDSKLRQWLLRITMIHIDNKFFLGALFRILAFFSDAE